MELRKFGRIIRDNSLVFWGIPVLFVVLGISYSLWKPISYTTSMTVSITRKGTQTTQDYKFDDFYRLQADERFAETLVQWLKSPSIVSEILKRSGITQGEADPKSLSKIFDPKKLSSQVVSMTFSSESEEKAEKLSQAMLLILRENTESLNQDQKQENWFKIIGKDPLIVRDTADLLLVVFLCLAAGFFVSTWSVLLINYYKES